VVPSSASADAPATYRNPVYTKNMPDPGVLLHEGTYYAFGTTGADRLSDGRVFRVLSSVDLIHWREHGGALTPPSDDARKQYWAPEVAYNAGAFYLYYSVGTLHDLRFEIRVAKSESPLGPYNDTGMSLKDGDGAPFFIDGHAFRDDDGQWYFFYAKDFLDNEGGARTGTGIVVDRLIDMVRLAGKPKTVVRPRYDWTLFEADRVVPMLGDKPVDWHTIEAPWVVKRDGKYYCLYSGSNFGTSNYGVDYVVANSVMGDYGDQGRYARVLRGVTDLVRGPGHHSVVPSPDGAGEVIVYHAWDREKTRREMWVDPMVWTFRGPLGVGPSVSDATLAPITDSK
jgi:beta-xylosidase